MISKAGLNSILVVLDAMIQYELALSELYQVCDEVSEEEPALWRSLSQAEISHVNNIRKMSEILSEKHERFEAGRPFNVAVLNTAVAGVKDMTGKISRGEVPFQKMLILARDFEQSILESHYAEIVKTTDVQYLTLMKSILSQTQEHKKAIQTAIENAKRKD